MAAFSKAHIRNNDTFLESPSRDHPRDILVKRGRDCGTFTIYCGGLPETNGGERQAPAPMACANACYYINNFNDGSFSTTYISSTDNTRNRQQSGCTASTGSATGQSVCNIAPFSQRFQDELDNYSTATSFSCDEFPMADMQQSDFNSDDFPRNTLRCIPFSDNGAAGNQLNLFVSGLGWYSQDESLNGGRSNECSGALQDGDTYSIKFDYDGDDDFDKSKISFCKEADGTDLMDPTLWDDNNEFYMTQLSPIASTGKIDFPYNPMNDNKYADGATERDTLQCSVTLYRTGDTGYEADVGYADGTFNQASAQLANDDDFLIVEGQNKYEPLKVVRTGPLGTDDGSEVLFLYAMGDDTITEDDLYFA